MDRKWTANGPQMDRKEDSSHHLYKIDFIYDVFIC